MTTANERLVLSASDVSVHIEPPQPSMAATCTVELHTSRLDLVSDSYTLSLPFTSISTINLHQPVFGANYVTGEYVHNEESCTFTLTFKKGGATDFTRVFFRIAEGRLEQDLSGATSSPHVSSSQQETTDDKKNR